MKILITGAAGAIGSHVAEHFAKQGHMVTGVDCLTPYYDIAIKKINIRDIEAQGVRVVFDDLATGNLNALINDSEIIFHFAAQPGISATTPFEEYVRNNITATHHLLEAARQAPRLQGVVYVSTSSIYGTHAHEDETTDPRPTSYYGVTKLAAEQLALAYYRTFGVPVTALRLFSVYGERERPEKLYHKLIRSIFNDQDFPLHEGSEHHIRSYTHVADIVQACDLVLNNLTPSFGEIFNIGTDTTVTTGEGISIIEKLIGKKAHIVTVPRRVGDQVETGAKIAKARKVFGYNPMISIEDGLAREVNWYRDKIHGTI